MALPRYTSVDATQPGITDLPEELRPKPKPVVNPYNTDANFQDLWNYTSGTPSSPSTTGSSGGDGGALPPSSPSPSQRYGYEGTPIDQSPALAPAPLVIPEVPAATTTPATTPSTGAIPYETMGNIPGVRMPDGGWRPLTDPAAQAYIASFTQTSGTGTAGTGTTGTGGTDAAGGTQVPGSSITIPEVPSGATVTGGGTTVTTPGGATVTTAEPPPLDTTSVVGETPVATAPGYDYSPEDPMMAVVRQELINLLFKSKQPVTLEDPALKPQADANYAAQERARRDLMEQTAARYGAAGLGSSGAMDTAMRQGYEDVGQATGEFNAGLIGDETTARREDLKDALKMANELGMFKEQTKLERDLAMLDTETKIAIANQVAALQNTELSLKEKLGTFDALLKQYGIDLQGDMGLLNMLLENEFDYATLQMQGSLAALDAETKRTIAKMDADLRQQGLNTQERLAKLDAEVRRYGIDTQGDLGRLEVALRKELGIGQLNLGFLSTILGNQLGYDALGWDMAQWGADQNANIADYL